MSLPASQRRALNRIEKTLADDHPGLGSMFALFGMLVDHEAMPVSERFTARRWHWQWRVWPEVTVVGLAMVLVALCVLGLTLPSQPPCQGTVTSVTGVAARPLALTAGHLPACATQQDQPGRTSQTGLHAH